MFRDMRLVTNGIDFKASFLPYAFGWFGTISVGKRFIHHDITRGFRISRLAFTMTTHDGDDIMHIILDESVDSGDKNVEKLKSVLSYIASHSGDCNYNESWMVMPIVAKWCYADGGGKKTFFITCSKRWLEESQLGSLTKMRGKADLHLDDALKSILFANMVNPSKMTFYKVDDIYSNVESFLKT